MTRSRIDAKWLIYTLMLCIGAMLFAPMYAQQPGFGGYNPNQQMMGGNPNQQMMGGNPNQQMMGGNPNQQMMNGDPNDPNNPNNANPQDTTEQKIRKPLESYLFSDSTRSLRNWRWNIDRDYNQVTIDGLDTTLAQWHLDVPGLRRGVGDMHLGALGQASQATNYFDRENSFNFGFAQPYDAYTYNMENVPFYNLKTPFTQLNYLESTESKSYREVNFGIIHAQNISPSTSFSVDYKSRGTGGIYVMQDISNENLSANIAHTGKRYSVHGGFIYNRIRNEENGGVVASWAIRDTTFEKEIGIPMKLGDAAARNDYRNTSFFVHQAFGIPLLPLTDYDFTMANLPAIYIGHSIEYNRWSKVYRDKKSTYTDERASFDKTTNTYTPEVKEYYENWYINPTQTQDSLYESVLSNRLFLQAQPWDRDGVIGTLNGGLGLDNYTYSTFSLGDYVSGYQNAVKLAAWYAYASAEGKISKYVDWGAQAQVHPSGYRAGDNRLDAHVALSAFINGKPLILSGALSVESRSPNYWQENLFSNHFAWFTPLDKEDESRLEVRFEVPDYGLELAAWQGIVTNKIYYDSKAIVAQTPETINLTSLYARKDFHLGGFHLNHRALMQWSSNHIAIPVPLFSANLSYYYEFWVVRDVLRVQAGVDGRYTSEYYMPGYNPALSTFYNQRDEQMGGYPYVDAFVSAKWKRMRILLKYQHANQGLFGNNEYFTVANYPMNPTMFKFGISWAFYD